MSFQSHPVSDLKRALRLVLHLLRQEKESVAGFGEIVIRLRNEIMQCRICHNISDTEICDICSNPFRNPSLVCVVENIRDVISVENTRQFTELYHVLEGVISPVDGIAPSDLEIESLIRRVRQGGISEVILALPATMEGDTTNFNLFRKLKSSPVAITTFARGIPVGDDLEYTDEITLGRSILNRIDFERSLGETGFQLNQLSQELLLFKFNNIACYSSSGNDDYPKIKGVFKINTNIRQCLSIL